MPMLKDPSAKYRRFEPIGLKDRTWPDRVLSHPPIWLSTDLRDGNQALIEPMNRARKRRMFETVVKVGFKEIEVGFPSASQTDFDFVRSLINEHAIPDDVTIQVLTPARENLIRRTFEAVKGARRVIMHVYTATAPVMRRVVFGMSPEAVIKMTVEHALMIKSLAEQAIETEWVFQYSPEMFSGTELDFSKAMVDAVTGAWESSPANPCIINLPSTVEHSTPNVFADMVEWMHRNLARRDAIVLSVHPHNDRGTGTAAAELALMAGCDRVEGCLFGNGERTGNVDVVNLALNLYSQGIHPGLDFSDIDALRSAVEYCNQLPVHPRHPYVGDLVYTSFSGSHQDAIKKAFAARQADDRWEMPYLPMDPKDLGRSYEAVIRVNSQSGKGGIAYLLETEYGLTLPRRLQIEFSGVVQQVTDATGKELSADDIWNILDREYLSVAPTYRYLSHHLVEDSTQESVQLTTDIEAGGQKRQLSGKGNGPIDAFVHAMTIFTGEQIRLLDYQEHSVGAGAKATAVTYIDMRINEGPSLYGVGMDSNIVTASLKAIVSGLNRYAAAVSREEAASALK